MGGDTCGCGCLEAWVDAAGNRHCSTCEPPPLKSLVVKSLVYRDGGWQNITPAKPPSRPPTPLAAKPLSHPHHKRCADCGIRRELWVDVKDRLGRVKVECRVCGRFIGYRREAKKRGK